MVLWRQEWYMIGDRNIPASQNFFCTPAASAASAACCAWGCICVSGKLRNTKRTCFLISFEFPWLLDMLVHNRDIHSHHIQLKLSRNKIFPWMWSHFELTGKLNFAMFSCPSGPRSAIYIAILFWLCIVSFHFFFGELTEYDMKTHGI